MTYSKLWKYTVVDNKIKEEELEVIAEDGGYLTILTHGLRYQQIKLDYVNKFVNRHITYYTDKKSFQEYRKLVLQEINNSAEELKSEFDKLSENVCVEDLDSIMTFGGLNMTLREFIRIVEQGQNLKEADLNNMTNDELGKYIDKLDRIRGL